MLQDTKEIIQFEHIDHEQVDEKQLAVLRAKFKDNLAKQNAESKKRSTMREQGLQKNSRIVRRVLSTNLKLRSSFALKKRKAAETKNQVQTVKISHQQQATTASKEVTGVQRQCQSVSCRGHKS